MSTRRMISSKVCCSEAFLCLPARAQALYIQLVLQADSDGFLDSAVSARRAVGGTQAFRALVEAGFLLELPEGVVLIRHWLQANLLSHSSRFSCMYPAYADKIYVLPDKTYSLTPSGNAQTLALLREKQQAKKRCASTGNATSESEKNAGREENTREDKTREEKTSQGNAPQASAFLALWGAYPEARRGSESEARAAFAQEIPGQIALSQALSSLERWKASDQWHRQEGRFIPSLANYLLRGAWRSPPPLTGERASCTLGNAELEAIRQLLAEECRSAEGQPPQAGRYAESREAEGAPEMEERDAEGRECRSAEARPQEEWCAENQPQEGWCAERQPQEMRYTEAQPQEERHGI